MAKSNAPAWKRPSSSNKKEDAVAATSATAELPKPPLAKIIATIGPASSSAETIRKLIEAGVSIFRLNFSHGTLDDHAQRARTIREVADSLGRPTAIMGDLQGPKIRVGRVAEPGVEVAAGSTVIFQRGDIIARPDEKPPRLASTYPRLIDDIEPGQRLLVNDGAVRMLIVAKRPDEIECTVTTGGLITSGKGINLPDTHLSVEILSERDWKNVEWALANDLDFLALSFVRQASDVIALREGMAKIAARIGGGKAGGKHREFEGANTQDVAQCPVHIIAKIELPKAVANIESIIDAADAIMIARGDLGVEMDLARVPVIQKQLLATAEEYGKPCIVATQMLESMIHSSSPTRAEANDVACAIMDGADAVMLSGETAIGEYPVVAVESMRRIAQYTEQYLATLPQEPSPPQKLIESRYRTAALAHGVWTIAQDIAAKFIVVWSQQGGGARYLSQNKFTVPIIAISSDDRAARQMQLLRGVMPVRMPPPENLAHFNAMVDNYLLETGWARLGDTCILMAGAPIGRQGVTNSVAIHAIGDPDTGFARHCK